MAWRKFDQLLLLRIQITKIPIDPVHGSWMALNTKSSGERSITMAIFIMSANIAGLASGQVFQAKDKPLYRTAWTTVLALSAIGVAAAVWSNVQYWLLNRRLAKAGEEVKRYHP